MIRIVLFFLVSCFSLQIYGQRKSNRKPNVLFIIADDLTATAVSAYENQACQTPNIDRLAAEGIRYTRTYCQYPVCGPSRASLLSGYYPHATQTFGYISGRENIGEEKKMLPQVFKENGYYTARVSKIFHMGVPTHILTGENGTDDEASWTERFNSQGPEWKAEGEAELVQGNPFGLKPKAGGNVMTIVKAAGDDLVHSDGITAKKASELIRKHKDKPFFLAVGFVRPHVPFVAPAAYFEPYPWKEMVLPPSVENDWDDIPPGGINYVTSVNAQMTSDQERKAIAAYYASVAYMDAQVGKVLSTLREEGLEDNTIVVFTSDHGFHLGEHRFWMKVSLHEESARVPLIIKVPGKAPTVCHSMTELIDLYPTLLELAGLSGAASKQGKSLVRTFDHPEIEVREAAFSVNTWKGTHTFLLRTRKWAFIQYGEEGEGGMELFDMEFDEKQFNNLAHHPRYAPVVKTFKAMLAQKLADVRSNDLGIDYTVTR